jgi:hypothetical protein
MSKRRFKSEADIARFVKQGYGQGEGSAYIPWIRVQDVPSRGRPRKVPGIKSGRTHHTLSDLEYYYLLLLEFSSEVVDIREQYPVFPTARARDLAAELGIRYPMYVVRNAAVGRPPGAPASRRVEVRNCGATSPLENPDTLTAHVSVPGFVRLPLLDKRHQCGVVSR